MILPSKHTSISNSLLFVGAKLLEELKAPTTVSSLWERVKTHPETKSYEKFTLAITMLFIMRVIDLDNGFLRKVQI